MGLAFRFAQQFVFRVAGLPWLGISILGVLTLSPALLGQTSPDSEGGVAVPTDWSHRHLVFSKPVTPEQAIRVERDPRYWQQLIRRSLATLTEATFASVSDQIPDSGVPRPRKKHHKLKADWQQVMNAGATVGAGQYPAKAGFNLGSASCASDFAVFNTGLAGSGTQASIIAYKNLYVGCGGTVPQVYWAYNTGGTITTSVTFSALANQVAFVQAQAGVATLVLLKWANSGGTISSPSAALTTVTNANYRACTAPCMTTFTFQPGSAEAGTITDGQSAPFYDFTGTDTLYAGDDLGYLHQFTGVFVGTPAETTGGTATTGFPATVAVVPLSSPVFDSTTGNVFVTTSYRQAANSGARFAAVCATNTCTGVQNGNGATVTAIGTVTPSRVLGPTKSPGVACHPTGASGNGIDLRLDSPIVDSTAGKAYVFLGNDGNGNSAVIQFSTKVGTGSGQFTWHTCGAESTVGTGSTTVGIPIYAGAFDNLYYSSTAASPTGNLYVCGNTSGNPTLYQVRITSNAIAASGTSALAVSNVNTGCSPVTEVFSASTDLVFLSVATSSTGSPLNCSFTTGCLMSFSVPISLIGSLPSAPTAKFAATGGTSGIVIDNTVAPGTQHTSQVYFSTLSNQTCNGTTGVGCAVQASQSALQ